MRHTRRSVLLTGAASLAIAGTAAADAPARKPPNIIFILADDLGYADLSCYGSRHIRTPNIDRIAAEGVRFDQAYANSAVCSATRTALITGRYQYRLPIGLEEPLAGRENIGLPPDHPTLPSILKKAGYSTTLIGKWHLGGLPTFGPLQSGYDHFFGFRGGALDYYTHAVGNHPDLWDDDVPVKAMGYLTDLFGDRAVQVIDAEAKGGKPFLISLHFNAPHWPWEAPGDEAEAERLRTSRDAMAIRDFDGGTMVTYQRMVEQMDRQIGRVVRALDDHGLADNTIIIFTSDNGGERFADTWPFSGRKTELLEGGLRIPAVVRWPAGGVSGGGLSHQTAMSMDWLPTLTHAAGTGPDPAYPTDGIDLMPALTGAKPVARRLYWRYHSNHQRAMRDGDLKILKILDNTFLFDVAADPQEKANLKDRRPEDYHRMANAWTAWNNTMLPEDPRSHVDAFDASQLADHIGAKPSTTDIDQGALWPGIDD